MSSWWEESLEPRIAYMAFDVAVTANLLNVRESDVEDLVSKGQLKVVWAGGMRRIPIQELELLNARINELRNYRGKKRLLQGRDTSEDHMKNRQDLVRSRSTLATALQGIEDVLRSDSG